MRVIQNIGDNALCPKVFMLCWLGGTSDMVNLGKYIHPHTSILRPLLFVTKQTRRSAVLAVRTVRLAFGVPLPPFPPGMEM